VLPWLAQRYDAWRVRAGEHVGVLSHQQFGHAWLASDPGVQQALDHRLVGRALGRSGHAVSDIRMSTRLLGVACQTALDRPDRLDGQGPSSLSGT